MLTRPAALARALNHPDFDGVASRHQLRTLGIAAHHIDAQVAAGRWRRVGPAVVLHNGPVTEWQRRRVCIINCGPRALLTSFTAAQEYGLRRWERSEVHVLAPAGTPLPRHDVPLLRGLVLHRVHAWDRVERMPGRRMHGLAQSLLVAAKSFGSARHACGLLAAAVQQRLIRVAELHSALLQAPTIRHRRAMLLALADLDQGADALSEIDLGRLCRRFGLPQPTRQAVRVDATGRRRYLDAEWRLPDGRVVAVEVDGAHHMESSQWEADQLRQNEIVAGGTIMLRFPSVVIRERPELVAAQLRRVLL